MTLMVATRNISLFSCIKCLIKSAGSHQLALHRVVHRLALLVRSRAYSLEDIDLHPFLPRSLPLSATVRLRPSVVVVLLYFVYFFVVVLFAFVNRNKTENRRKHVLGAKYHRGRLGDSCHRWLHSGQDAVRKRIWKGKPVLWLFLDYWATLTFG